MLRLQSVGKQYLLMTVATFMTISCTIDMIKMDHYIVAVFATIESFVKKWFVSVFLGIMRCIIPNFQSLEVIVFDHFFPKSKKEIHCNLTRFFLRHFLLFYNNELKKFHQEIDTPIALRFEVDNPVSNTSKNSHD